MSDISVQPDSQQSWLADKLFMGQPFGEYARGLITPFNIVATMILCDSQDDVPDTVIINEAIDIAKIFGSDDSYRFVNGVLDGIRKEKNREKEGPHESF